MAVSYQVERFPEIAVEVQPLWIKHWLTSGVDRDKIRLDPDLDAYMKADAAGVLHIVTARKDGVLIGYFFSFIMRTGLHYRGLCEAHSDIYYIDCDDAPMARLARYRGLLRTTTRELASLGVQKVTAPVKLHADLGTVFERSGWTPVERSYYILLGA